jgi:uracil-DNA glycosylase
MDRSVESVAFSTPGAGSRSKPDTQTWQELSDEIRACRLCSLHETRTQAVVYRGSLAPTIVFVGEAPGAAEDRAGVPFVGRSGQRLDAAIKSVRLTAGEFGVLNLLKCRPPQNRFDRNAARTCRPYLDRQLAFLAPRALVSVGAHAFRALAPDGPAILTAAGRPYPNPVGRPLFPLIHPAAAMRSRKLAERWEHDVRALGRWLRRRTSQPV